MPFSLCACFTDEGPADTGGTGGSTGGGGTATTTSASTSTSTTGMASSTGPGTTAGGSVPPKPIDVAVTAEPIKRIRITWTPSPGADGYAIDWASGTDPMPDWLPLVSNVPQPAGTMAEYVVAGAFLPAWAGAKVRIRACNQEGCSDWSDPVGPATVDPAVGYFKALQVQAGARFGAGAAASEDGRVIAGGAPQHAFQGNTNVGAVVVARYDEDAEQWNAKALPPPMGASADTYFGGHLALSADGNRLAASAKGLGDRGGVVVYDWDGSDWNLAATLMPPPAPMDGGTPGADWSLTGERSIALSRDGAWVAAGSTVVHRVAIWHDDGGSWSVHTWLAGDDVAPGAFRFGYGVALSADGTRLAVGAAGDPGQSGTVYVFERQGDTWSKAAELAPEQPETDTGYLADGFGAALAFSADGTRLAVGAPFDDGSEGGPMASPTVKSAATARSGAVYLYDRNGDGTWVLRNYVKAQSPRKDDRFGFAVSLSSDGKLLAVGVREEDGDGVGLDAAPNAEGEDVGAVYVFREFDAGWGVLRYVKPYPVAGANDRFGRAVTLSGDGRTLVVGADFEDGSGATPDDDGSTDAGALYLY